MQLNLTGQRVAVVGSSNGIGQAIARAFVAEGCHVRGFDRVQQPELDTTRGDVMSFDEVMRFATAFETVDHSC